MVNSPSSSMAPSLVSPPAGDSRADSHDYASGKDLDDARSLGVSDVLAIDDDKAIEKFRLVDAIADTVGGRFHTKLMAKVRQNGFFGYASLKARRSKIRQ